MTDVRKTRFGWKSDDIVVIRQAKKPPVDPLPAPPVEPKKK